MRRRSANWTDEFCAPPGSKAGQELVDAAHGVTTDDLREDVGEIGLRIDFISLARLDE
jgi:hypothetical protein